jgi:hypothetical protein
MKKFNLVIVGLAAIFCLGLTLTSEMTFAATTVPSDNITTICNTNPDSSVCKDWKKNAEQEVTNSTQDIINLLLYAIGIIAVVVIIISGIRFVSSRGDSNAVSKARTTLIYSVVGLVVATMAFAIVNFVFFRLSDSGGGTGGGSSKITYTKTAGDADNPTKTNIVKIGELDFIVDEDLPSDYIRYLQDMDTKKCYMNGGPSFEECDKLMPYIDSNGDVKMGAKESCEAAGLTYSAGMTCIDPKPTDARSCLAIAGALWYYTDGKVYTGWYCGMALP